MSFHIFFADVLASLGAREILTYSPGSRDVLNHLANNRDASQPLLFGNRDMSYLLTSNREGSYHNILGNREIMSNLTTNVKDINGRDILVSLNSSSRDPSSSILTSRDLSSAGSRDVLSYALKGSREFPTAGRDAIPSGKKKVIREVQKINYQNNLLIWG